MALNNMLAVCVLAVMMAGGAAAAGQQTTWLADVLHPRASSSGVAAAAQHYAELVHEKVSLPILKGDGCDCVVSAGLGGGCVSQVFSQTLGCPTKEKPYSTQSGSFSTNFGASSAGVASCTYQLSYAGSGFVNELAPGVGVVGTVSFICDFNGGADKCESPLCDGMTITGFGRVLEIPNNEASTKVFFTSWGRPDGMDPSDNVCLGGYMRQGARKTGAPGQNKKKAHAQEQAAVQTASYSYYDDEADTLYYPGGLGARVLLGTFTVVSAHSPTKFTSGRIQSVSAYYEPDLSIPPAPTPVTTLPPGALVFTPWTVDLEFISSGSY